MPERLRSQVDLKLFLPYSDLSFVNNRRTVDIAINYDLQPKQPRWIGTMPQASGKIISFDQFVNAGCFEAVEVYSVKKDLAARLYTEPLGSRVPTIILGDPYPVCNAAYYDHTSVHPLLPGVVITEPTIRPIIFPDSMKNISVLQEILGRKKLFYTIRNSTFVPTLVVTSEASGIPVLIQLYVNRLKFESGEFFVIYSPIDTDSPLIFTADEKPVWRVVFTNAAQYKDAHPTYNFIALPHDQSPAFDN